MNWLANLKKGMAKTATLFHFSNESIKNFEEIEDILIQADVGYSLTQKILEKIKKEKPSSIETLELLIHKEITTLLSPYAQRLIPKTKEKPFVILTVGVNGSGKTTTIGKLAYGFQKDKLKVSFIAADTFRAGAVEQLKVWANKLSCPIYHSDKKVDPAGLIFDGLQQSILNEDDVVMIDTAGRLQNKKDLMDELQKINRVIKKVIPTAPHACILVIESTVGQNALNQVKCFQEILPLTGIILTKLDGTAKGGILLSLTESFKLPIYAIGIGEKVTDLNPFTAEEYATALLGKK